MKWLIKMLCTTLQQAILMPKGPLWSTIIVSDINLLWQTNSKNKLLMGAWVPVYYYKQETKTNIHINEALDIFFL